MEKRIVKKIFLNDDNLCLYLEWSRVSQLVFITYCNLMYIQYDSTPQKVNRKTDVSIFMQINYLLKLSVCVSFRPELKPLRGRTVFVRVEIKFEEDLI